MDAVQQYLAEDGVLAVEPSSLHGGDEELRAVGVGAGVGHGEEACRQDTRITRI